MKRDIITLCGSTRFLQQFRETERALTIAAIDDASEEVRLTCLDYLKTKKRPDVVAYFVGKLKAKDNVTVNLAGVALRLVRHR